MTTWKVTRTYLVEADTFDEAVQATDGTAPEDVTGIVIGQPTGTMARYMAHLLERDDYWRKTVGVEEWERALAYWRERFTDEETGT